MIGRSIYDELVKRSNKQYDSNFVSRSLIQIKRSSNDKLRDELKLEIYYSQSKLFVKAINNFFSLVKTISEEKVIHTKEDIASECYIVMSKCIDNLKIKDLKKFYFYLNTSLNRAMYRLYERRYKKHFDILPNTDDVVMISDNTGYTDHFDMSSIDLRGFTTFEVELIEFKVSGEKLSVFLKLHKINNAEFQAHFETVKIKLADLYQKHY